MTTQLEEQKQATFSSEKKEDLASIIQKAVAKAGCRRENDLCRFIPGSTGGYMHHFTLKKMKKKQPQELARLIEQFILSPAKLSSLPSKQRAARGSRKKRDVITFTKPVLERLLQLAKTAGDKEVVSMLRPSKSFPTLKRELIQSIRQNRVDQDLWSAFADAAGQMASLSGSHGFQNPFQD